MILQYIKCLNENKIFYVTCILCQNKINYIKILNKLNEFYEDTNAIEIKIINKIKSFIT